MLSTIVYGAISFLTILFGIIVFVHLFPEKRWMSEKMTVLFYCLVTIWSIAQAWDSIHGFIPYLQIIFYGVVNALIVKVFFDSSFLMSLAWVWMYTLIISFLKIPYLMMRGIYEEANLYAVNVGEGRLWSEGLWCLGLLSISVWICMKGRRQLSLILKRIAEKTYRAVCFLGIELAGFQLLWYMMRGNREGNFNSTDILINTILLLCVSMGIISYTLYNLYSNSRAEQRMMEIQWEMLNREYEAIRIYCKQDAKRLHDIRHTLLYLKRCIEEKDMSEAQKCLEEHLEEARMFERWIWTGIADVDYILNYEYERMKRKDIGFRADIEIYGLPISGEKFMIIIGNLFDNAIEAVMRCPVQERKIELKLKEINEMFYIEMKNPCAETLVKEGKRLLSRKEDVIRHGWGLENIRQIVEEYDGVFQYTCENSVFEIKIMLMRGLEEGE